ncbi:hypothetical protein [Deinococcus hopiensis]|uniref:Uncharacterized protein n=1 Tax=Deinococcus hopiensis KR-140 TaxID=695939 RepID=A0A1W1V852_9DEIO|nr:hypothetical protein [Deinococcus hopiensis]SMB89538.1 hypothetical protein SAMN00790413_00466 [Deinococcus hopiensis KR-140]
MPFGVAPYATLAEVEVQARPPFAHLIAAYARILGQNGLYGHKLFRADNGVVCAADRGRREPQGLPSLFSETTAHLRAFACAGDGAAGPP